MTTNFIVGGEGDLDANRYLYSYEENLIDDAVNTAGRLWMWGSNSNGQLGDNTTAGKSSPVQTVSAGTDWKQASVNGNGGSSPNGVFAGAIKSDGSLWMWGGNNAGQLGDNTSVQKSSPVQTVSGGTNWKLIDGSCQHTATIKTDGSLWLWGSNNNGQLGDNTQTTRSSPVQTVSGGTNWRQVSCGGGNTVDGFTAAIKIDGTLWMWGLNGNGQLGDNSTTSRSSPVQTVSGGTNWKQVSCGYTTFTAAIKTDGTLWTWGINTYGQLGDNTTAGKSSPVQTVSAGTDWKSVSCGAQHTVAIKTDGTLWAWGSNNAGALGDNTNGNSRSSPVQTVAGGTNWKQADCSGTAFLLSAGFTVAVKTDGTLWTWGGNGSGQLGDNSTTHRSSPVQTVAGGTNWRQVACGCLTVGAVTY